MNNKIKKNNKKRGFTLIEMLIAVLIFSISISSIMAISSKALKTSKNAEEQLIADYLALEAVEVIHNLRDAALLKGLEESSWELVFQGGEDIIGDDEGCFNGTGYCNIYSGGSQLILANCTDCDVYLNKTNFYYYQIDEDNPVVTTGSTKTKYKRTIKIKESTDHGQVIVYVTVTWDGGEVRYVENLYLWQ